MAERRRKPEPIPVRTMEQLLQVVDDVINSDESTPIELRNGRRVNISPEPRSIATPANGEVFTPEEISERRAIIASLFGVWSDIDGEAWKKRIKAERGSNRPLVDFDR